ncbi:MAG: FtsQ-type POTRA domain-containing protein [Planctomycetes bacterium]|nr:FtsQ-type POTRA domain-containing protein [Planctomycetota bacterium]MCB9889876.1 FtsQ-type POTRA domain-containing protein [Planctomycetota bacterium]
MTPTARWAVWGVVLGALALTLWLAGPRAAAVMAARYEQSAQRSPPVDLDRVGFASRPKWLEEPLLLAVCRDLGPWLQDQVPILDEAGARRLRDGLKTVPWVDEASLERVFPDKFKVNLTLRRPVLAVRDAEGQGLCLVDAEARALPWVETALPGTSLFREGGAGSMQWTAGALVDEPRVRVAASIAVEWRDQVAPLVPGCPRLVEVDSTNLGERWLRGPAYPEVRVKLARQDGQVATFAYGRPVDSVLPRVSVRTKAQVLSNILAKRPGLNGLLFADLRLARRWADYLQPRDPGTPDPLGPWSELDRGPR